MSRFVKDVTKNDKRYQIAYGHDHMLGYFLTVYDEEKDEGAGEGVVLDISSYDFVSPKDRGQITTAMREWTVPEDIIALVALDLPFDMITEHRVG